MRVVTTRQVNPGQGIYGWRVVLTAALGWCLGSASIIIFSFSVFLKPLSQEFHVGRGAISLAYTLYSLTAAISVLLAGRLVDRYGARKVIAPCSLIFAVILICNRFIAVKLSALYIFYVTLGIVAVGMGPIPYSDVVSHWFGEESACWRTADLRALISPRKPVRESGTNRNCANPL